MRAALTVLITALSLLAVQNAGATVPSGLYEGYSPILMAPFGPLDKATAKRVLPRWLKVDTQGQQVTIDFMPDKRVRWILTYGPHGPTQKITEVDGDAWTTSTFTYDAKGHLTGKKVDGPGLAKPIEETVLTDASGRRTEKRDKTTGDKTWSAVFNPKETVATHWIGKNPARVDTFDPRGRLTSTSFPPFNTRLTYRRSGNGALQDIRWTLPSGKGAAMPLRRDPKINSLHLRALSQSMIERHEALLLLGQPITHSDLGKGTKRSITDDYSPDCWLNEPSQLVFDASGLLAGTHQACICGFCVDAALPIDAVSVLGVDTHWTAGPWIRLDDSVDVTADHRIMTPTGPRSVGELRAGDAVLDDTGKVKILRSVQRLPVVERLGRNVRTTSGYFGAGGLLFESESPVSCPQLGATKQP